jgi:hypothetical protein
MEGDSGDENTEFEEFVDEIMYNYQPELDQDEDCFDSEGLLSNIDFQFC